MNNSIFPYQVVKLVSEIKNMISNYFLFSSLGHPRLN